MIKATYISLLMASSLSSVQAGEDQHLTLEQICSKEGIECLQSTAGVVIGRTGATAGYADGISTAAKSFQEYFGAPAPKAAVILGEVMDHDIRISLRSLYPIALPWLTTEDRRNMVEGAIRRQIKEQAPELTGEQLEATVQRSVEASLAASGEDTSEDVHQGVFSHELGHLFFINSFWPEVPMNVLDTNPAAAVQYGGPAPDWLDEMAAVLMENKPLAEGRIRGLEGVVESSDFNALWPLEEYFSMEHPVFQQARELVRERQKTEEGRAQGGVVILSSDELHVKEGDRNPALFYAQSYGFAQFMIERTGDKQVFADIARAIASGGTIQEWLVEHGPGLGLPPTIAELEGMFFNWLGERYSVPA